MAAKVKAPCHEQATEGIEQITNQRRDFATTAQQVTSTGANRGKIQPKAKAPVLQNTFGKAVAAPTDKRGFVTPEFLGRGLGRTRMVYGHGGVYPQGRPHGFTRVLNHHAHPLCFKTHRVVLKSRKGASTMQVNHHPMGQTAPAYTPTTDTTSEQMAFALLEAVTSTNLAGFYLRRDNVAQARRKLRQALQALHTLEVSHA